MTNLRPELIINQVFSSVSPIVPTSRLPVLLVGINRNIQYKAAVDLVDWNGGSVTPDVPFPNWLGGVVEATSATDPYLRPHVYVENTYGLAELEGITYSLGSTPPTFTIPDEVSGTFEVSSGTTGTFAIDTDAPNYSTFTDANADFIDDAIAEGDVIKVGGIPTYVVSDAGLLADDQLSVQRLDKGPSTAGAVEASKVLITAEDTNDVRKMIITSSSYEEAGGLVGAGVKVNDLVILDHWSVRSQGLGLIYDYVGEHDTEVVVGSTLPNNYALLATDRLVTYPSNQTLIKWDNTAGEGTVVFLANDEGEFVPAFYGLTGMTANLYQAVRDYAVNEVDDLEDEDTGAVYKAYSYTLRAAGTTFGAFTAEDVNGLREFFDNSLGAGGFADTVVVGDHIAIADADGIYKPTFVITDLGDAASPTDSPDTDGRVTVQVLAASMLNAAYPGGNVNYIVLNPGTPASFLGASVTATATSAGGVLVGAYTTTGAERVLTAAADNFFTEGVTAGDLVFTDKGILAFIVTKTAVTGDPTKLVVKVHENSGLVLTADETIAAFGYSVRKSLRSDFRIRRVINSTTAEIKALVTTPNTISGVASIKGAIFFQTPIALTAEEGSNPALIVAPDASSSLSYTIEKTLSGGNLEGDVKITYLENRNDDVTVFPVNSGDYVEKLGAAVPANPLGLAARIATGNTTTEVFVLRVTADTVDAWQEALDTARTDIVYSIVPLTQNEEVLALARAHVLNESLPANKRERILYQSSSFPLQTDRTSSEADDAPSVSRTAGGVQTVTILRDLSLDGVIVGDAFAGVAFDGSTTFEFGGRITVVEISGSSTVLTMLPDGVIAVSTTDMPLVSYTVKSKLLSITELRDKIADYANALNERRFRNIYPDRCEVSFTDSTGTTGDGLYGGGEVVGTTLGSEYVCAGEAAKRAKLGAARPLTKTAGSGIYGLLDRFLGKGTYQDVIIDSGTYYMEEVAGKGSGVQAIRALTTNNTDLIYVEDSVTTQIDNMARQLRAQLKPLLGPFLLDEGFYTVLSAQQAAVTKQLIDDREMKSIDLLSLSDDPDAADSFQLTYQVQPFFSAARGTITIFV
jgi:hypothetical protein